MDDVVLLLKEKQYRRTRVTFGGGMLSEEFLSNYRRIFADTSRIMPENTTNKTLLLTGE